ncbi:NfeD family protein [Rhodohalobacter sulfatireducens]|uniref:Nodulation protein NfeD n=1 Tax=Rhodohalobacter sulfatireducens TaxID=2911366 RepID=A0ABS9KHE3_9BACT|nr:nodulation protein NfeD [Rhodohalobacter sulfatireducens]MCG2590274.1 nodulation protein NfeD [Rhodohalobacter sulfatireducens]
MRSKKFLLASILFLSGTLLALQDSTMQSDSLTVDELSEQPSVSVIRVEGTIGPTVTQYITRSIRQSIENGDEALIIELDTPGGLLDSTQDIVQQMLGTDHPTVVYVTPSGANAGSAGTFITLAAHVAAMAPATNIGAASPISMGGGEMDTVAQKKIFNYSESFIESIADERDRNAEWARSAVRDGASISSDEALELNVIDILAEDIDDLLVQLDGMEVGERVLNTQNATISQIEETLAEQFFSFLLRPEVMLILTLVAIYGIIGEVTNPGAIVPGVSGVIALILLLYGVAAMPINLAGFLLIGLAIILFVAEAFTPAFGILLTGGAVSFFLGALMLFQDLPDEMQISLYWLVPATLLTVAFFAWIVTYGVKSLFNPPRSGLESTIGKTAEVVDTIQPDQDGRVFFDGEYWTAKSEHELEEGETCEIIEFQGLRVFVKPTEQQNIDETEKV